MKVRKEVKILMVVLVFILGLLFIRKTLDEKKSFIGAVTCDTQCKYNEENDKYAISIAYPKVDHKDLASDIETYIEDTIQKQRKMVSKGLKKELQIDFNVYQRNALLTYLATTKASTEDGSSKITQAVFYFDTDKQNVLQSDGLFVDVAAAHQNISKLAIQSSGNVEGEVFDKDQREAQLSPDKLEDKALILNQDVVGLSVLPNEVGPERAGKLCLKLDNDAVNTELKPEYQQASKQKENKATTANRDMRDIETLRGKSYVLLTFDDGPNPYVTNKLLDALKDRNVKATFFVVGSNAVKFPEIVKRTYEAGHSVGSHSYSHQNLVKMTPEAVRIDLEKGVKVIRDAIGVNPIALRPPYGNFNDAIKKVDASPYILWDIDSKDWKDRDANAIVNNIKSQLNGKSIVLMHDLYPTTAEGALKFIDELKSKGYEFISIEEAQALGVLTLNAGDIHYGINQ